MFLKRSEVEYEDLFSCIVSAMEICWPGPVFCLLLGVSPDYAQPIIGQVTEVTWGPNQYKDVILPV